MALSENLLMELQKYMDKHIGFSEIRLEEPKLMYSEAYSYRSDIEHFIKNKKQPSFSQMLLTHIDKTGLKDSEIYKRAGIDRRHFSKIRSNSDYRPGKNTVIALALALELNKGEASKLIKAAGYTLSDSESFDLVIKFCLEKKIYNIDHVNSALEYFSFKPLAGVVE